jgi:uncharacterized protein YbjT (DUF2867 family)
MMAGIFIAGATGYMGSRLVGQLVDDGHQVKALSRRAIDLPCDVVHGDALDASTYAENVVGCSSFVHLVGTPHPAPWKEKQFRKVDLASLKQSVRAAKLAEISHFVYVSVAHPAPAMRAYVRVRMECEEIIAGSGLSATILRPWYVLGPGHQWAHALRPFYWLAEQVPATRDTAQRLGLVTIDQMTATLARCVLSTPMSGLRVVPVPEIRMPPPKAKSALA